MSRRARDHPQDLRSCRLAIKRLGEVSVAESELREQPDVLDGDDRLVGEGPQEIDLPRGERPGTAARHRHDAHGPTLVEHWHADSRAKPDAGIDLAYLRRQILGIDVRDVHDRAGDKGANDERRVPAHDPWIGSSGLLGCAGPWIVLRSQMQEL